MNDIDNAIQLLQSHGYRITLPAEKPSAWETVGDILDRLQVPDMRLRRAMAAPGCPLPQMERSGTGRILRLRSHPEFDQFVLNFTAKKSKP